MNHSIKAFEPVVSSNTRILILGSMPGVASLNQNEYYAHPRNLFWPIIFSLWQQPLESDYNKKLDFLLSKGLGLWDVIASCEREGSLDSAIKNETPNDFEELFRLYPDIHTVIFNGGKAYEVFKKKVGFERFEGIEFVKLGSTSPARAVSFEIKKSEWEAVICRP